MLDRGMGCIIVRTELLSNGILRSLYECFTSQSYLFQIQCTVKWLPFKDQKNDLKCSAIDTFSNWCNVYCPGMYKQTGQDLLKFEKL